MKSIIIGVLFFAFSAVSFSDPLPNAPHIYVEGSSSTEVVPDTVTFTVEVESISDDVTSGKLDIDRRTMELIHVSRSAGVQDKNIGSTALKVRPSPVYKNGEKVQTRVSVSRQITITLKDLDIYSEVVSALTKSNISTTIETVASCSNEKELTDKALLLALSDARKRAEALARAQGKELGEPYSISEFKTRAENSYSLQLSRKVVGQSSRGTPPYVPPPEFSEPFEPGLMSAAAQVYVVYLLK